MRAVILDQNAGGLQAAVLRGPWSVQHGESLVHSGFTCKFPEYPTMNAFTTDALWMPFTANRDFKKQPRVICGAEGHHYTTTDGRRLYDTFSGLWTSGVGH
jgi:beta-alanine--pyruvate transaminase